MAISNTSVLIKRSSSTAIPSSLKSGELAYSYVSNTLFFGTVGGNGVVNVGGQYYTSTIDAATQSNTINTLVKRDGSGAFFGQLYGNANTATTLQNGRNFNIAGGDISSNYVGFDGSSGVTLNASLTDVVPTGSGSVGSSTSVPVIQYGANGRILSVSSASIQTSFNVSDGTSSNTVNGGSTLTLKANTNSGITANVTSGETVYFGVDNTVLRSNIASVGVQTIGTDVQISGNLTVTGTTTYVNTSIIQSTGSLMHLAANNTVGDVLDIGFVGEYNNGTANLSTGLIRDAGSKNYYLFANVAAGSVTGNTIANNLFTSSNTATLYANINANQATITTANITASTTSTANVTNDLGVGGTVWAQKLDVIGTTTLQGQANTTYDLGIGRNIFVTGNETITGTLSVTGQANTTNDLGIGRNLFVTGNETITGTFLVTGQANTTNDLGIGRNLYVTNNINASGLTLTNALTVPNGGTGQQSFSSGGILIGNGTGAINQLANSSFTVTGTGASNNTVTSASVDAYGRFTALTYSQITGLTVGQGGTGVSSFTTNGITYGNGTGPVQVTAAAGSADQTWSNQILTVTNAGVPVWTTTMDGGTF